MLIKPVKRIALQQIPLAKQQPRIVHTRSIGHRIAQQLRLGCDGHSMRLHHGLNRQHRSQRRAGTIATKRHARGIKPKTYGVFR
ncbi:hypothetical protein D3C72_352250 [compost metagenome]